MAIHQQSTLPLRRCGPVLAAILLAARATGCSLAPQPPPPDRGTGPGAAWLDAIVPGGRALVFAGAGSRMTLARTDEAVTLTVRPTLLGVPRLMLRADPPDGPPLRFQPRWSDMIYDSGFGRSYRIVTRYPRLGGMDASGARRVLDYGKAEYFMPSRPPDQPHVTPFHADIVPYTSPLHLVLIALGPIPQGRTELLAVHKDGVDYRATIESAGGRRELRFPYAMLWDDWSDKNLAQQCVFRVESVADWPATTVEMDNFTRHGDVTVKYETTGPIGP